MAAAIEGKSDALRYQNGGMSPSAVRASSPSAASKGNREEQEPQTSRQPSVASPLSLRRRNSSLSAGPSAQDTPTEANGNPDRPRGAVRFDETIESGHGSAEVDDTGLTKGEKQPSLLGKLISFASSSSTTTSHARNMSNTAEARPSDVPTPTFNSSEPTDGTEEVETDAEADEESDEDDNAFETRSQKRRKRPAPRSAESAPATPRMARLESRFASFIREQTHIRDGSSSSRPQVERRNTMSDVDGDERHAGISEDEGRDRLRAAWRRGIEGARGLSYSARKANAADSPSAEGPRRPNHFRRLTGMGSGVDGAGPPSHFRLMAERQASSSAQKWRQVKAGLKLLGQRKKDERIRIDHQKSAQLMAELLAGAPAALVFASMFQRDEHGHRKLPVLLEQLVIAIPDSKIREDKKGDRHLVFKIDLEYGNGPARMKWSIQRTLKDFVNLHVKYQSAVAADKVRHLRSEHRTKGKMPKFPRSAFPYARTIRGLFDRLQDDEDEDEVAENRQDAGPTIAPPAMPAMSEPETPTQSNMPESTPGATGPHQAMHRRRKSSFAPMRLRRTSTSELGVPPVDPNDLTVRQREMFATRQRRKLEIYLQSMIRWLIFRPDSTRLCKFLELSAIAIRLSVEGGYHGKQGLLTVASRRNRDMTMTMNRIGKQNFIDRHRPRWFLVRHSYIVAVDSPESLNIYDVFLVDSDFTTEKRKKRISDQKSAGDVAKAVAETTKTKHLVLRLYNSERKLKLIARTDRQLAQFQESIDYMKQSTVWSQKKRFSSFAPVRHNVWCRWLVDGRDHMWQVSRAIDNAKDFVYIHDWWLSPELYMRRPAAISQEWRLDRLLLRKARQGVKIFVIIYRNIESAIPIDSEYTKWSLLDLDPNIMVQRSPNQFRQNQFFWAHHEKLVVVDNMMAFVGGVDLCFGRWDDPCHSLTDDKLTGFEPTFSGRKDTNTCQVWPGKDYSNPRVQDFYGLNRPYEEMYDRTKVPRMPWHDISMQIIGQPARDVARHFVQRWNYILRSRVPSRPTPVLLPPPEYEYGELERVGMTGTCEVQILRSCSSWSMGTPNKVEHSIMNAYVHLIEHSEHFVYIENQFYVSSCTVEGTTIHNKIGDALVERTIRAFEKGENWRACLIIPLMPGFQNSVDSQDGTSIRLIMQCQYRSICRGESSIFGRLRAVGIDPEEYICFYSLRQWGKIGPLKCLTTEQLYIHAKLMIVDDRHVIIGSANINERSMLGSRDSEVAAVVTDTKMLPGFMGGAPYEVGEFPHTLRKRLMREHLGIDVDEIYRREEIMREREMQDREMQRIYGELPGPAGGYGTPDSTPPSTTAQNTAKSDVNLSSNLSNILAGTTTAGSTASLTQSDSCCHDKNKRTSADFEHDMDVEGNGPDNMRAFVEAGEYGFLGSYIDAHGHEVLLKKDVPGLERVKSLIEETKSHSSSNKEKREPLVSIRPPWPLERLDTYALGLPTRSQLPELPVTDDTDIGGPALTQHTTNSSAKVVNPLVSSLRRPEVNEDCMRDPVAPQFYDDIWHQVAENNTKLFRAVFRCMPDNEVQDWKAYERFHEYSERFMQSQGLGNSKPRPAKDAPGQSGPPGSGGADLAFAAGAVASEGRARSKSVVGGLVEKLRERSKTSNSSDSPNSLNEKEQLGEKDQSSPVRDSEETPHPNLPSVIIPIQESINEKEVQKLADQQAEDDAGGASGFITRQKTVQYSNDVTHSLTHLPEPTATQNVSNNSGNGLHHTTSQKRRRRATTKSSAKQPFEEILSREEAENLLELVQGRLVLWPYDWLEKEERGGNWLYNIDQLAPLEIYD